MRSLTAKKAAGTRKRNAAKIKRKPSKTIIIDGSKSRTVKKGPQEKSWSQL